jgi:type I site-specific restriction endonuclease
MPWFPESLLRPSESNSQWLTRKRVVDPKLKAAGWRIVPFSLGARLSSYDRCAIEEFETENGPADYALCVEGQILGIVEAKKLSLGPQGVLTQAERYSKGAIASALNFRGYRVPFLYSTNGEVIWHHDTRHDLCRSHPIAAFHTPDALTERLGKDFDAACQTLLKTPNDHPRLRPYQREANAAIEKAISDRKLQMLVAMATGTRKTFTMVNEVYRLMKSEVAKRILFLVDRRALAAQAVLAFSSFEPEPGLKFDKIYEVYSQRFQHGDFDDDEKFDPTTLPPLYLEHPKVGDAFVYVSTIQRMTINLLGPDALRGFGDEEIDEDATKEDIPIHAFDLIIADECHRGYHTLRAEAMGGNQPNLNLSIIKEWEIPMPPLEEQCEILRRVAPLLELADAIERHVSTANLRADKLTQSILAKAFRGELVPTEAELARHEGREYEPASVLLERIKKKRESAQAGQPLSSRRRLSGKAKSAEVSG